MKKHPKLIRYTIDVEHRLSILEGDEDDGDSPVVKGFTAEHALEVALVSLKHNEEAIRRAETTARRAPAHPVPNHSENDPAGAGERYYSKIEPIRALRAATNVDLRTAKTLVELVLFHAGADKTPPAESLKPDALFANWAFNRGWTPPK